ncbi:gfo/Idh/MocA family oxidoreductase, partial [bacterium]|nr:gfo/Idh/MocA family oxidoreductase [bacterium]
LTTDAGTQTFAICPPPHVHQPLVETVVDALLGRGECPSTGESAARTSRVMDLIVHGQAR